jgi:pimeloyl-ACP methyl ester carboxylesterase
MKKGPNQVFLLVVLAIAQTVASAQQLPFLSEFFSRYGSFDRAYSEKRRAGQDLSAIEPVRKRADEAFKRGNIPGLLEATSEGQALLNGKKWDESQKFAASLTLETDRLVIEPNQTLQVSLTRMFSSNIAKAFSSTPTVTFVIEPSESASKPAEAKRSVVIAERLAIAESSSTAARKLLLPDGVYNVVATIEARGQPIAEIKRPVYAIADFSDSVAQTSKLIASIKNSSDPRVKALAGLVATPDFQLQRLAQLNKTRGEVDLNPNDELDKIERALSAIGKGRNPFAGERAEIERAYQAADGRLVPYRVYVPKSYDGASARPLIVMLHGLYGDERYFLSGFFDPGIIKSEAERRGYILAVVNGGSRFGLNQEDVFEVTNATIRDYKIDPSRVYLIGHSIGAFATWLVASSKPETFSAIAAISGGPPSRGDALTALLDKLKGKPAMLVHGAQDEIVSVEMSRAMAAAAEKAGLRVSYLEVPDGTHLSVVASTFPAILDFFEKNVKLAGSK